MKCSLNEKWLVCRICLQQSKEPMQTIFNRNIEKDLTRMILECGGVPIKQFDHYPDKICIKCYKHLQVAYKFRTTCQRSHKQLSQFIAPVVVDKTEESVLDIDELTESPIPVEPVLLEQSTTDVTVIKTENLMTDDELPGDEFVCHVENEDEYLDIYEPMPENDQKSLIEISYEHFSETESLHQENVEYLDLDDELDLPSSDDTNCDIKNEVCSSANRMQLAPSHNSIQQQKQQPSTSRGQSTPKRVKREQKVKKSKHSPYICDLCGNKYPSQGRLTEHIKLHKGIKPHECEICGHAFAQTQQLARHMNTHTGNRPYKCSYCPAAFADLSTRNKHHRIHTNERPYVCDVCGKAFTYTNTLKFHKMIHTGEKPFVCDLCGKGFQQAYKLRSHKMVHEKKGMKLEKQRSENDMEHHKLQVTAQQENFIPIQMETVTQILQL